MNHRVDSAPTQAPWRAFRVSRDGPPASVLVSSCTASLGARAAFLKGLFIKVQAKAATWKY